MLSKALRTAWVPRMTVPLQRSAAASHREAALPAVTGEHYEGGHWLGTFAVYLTSLAGY